MPQTLSSLPHAALVPIALGAPPETSAAAPTRSPSTIERALDVVLERTRRGDEELTRHRFSLGATRNQLLRVIDGARPLRELTQPDANPNAQRLVSDAARLAAFGLCRSVRGELPQRFMVAAMNLTMRMPRALFKPPSSESARARPVEVTNTGRDGFQHEASVHPLQIAAAIVAALLIAWAVFEFARG